MFAEYEGKYSYIPTKSIDRYHEGLPSNAYKAVITFFGTYFEPVALNTDDYIPMNSKSHQQARREVENFFNEDITRKLREAGTMHKRGILLHGEPGTGKTSFAMSLLPTFQRHNAVVLVQPDINRVNQIIECVRFSDAERTIVIIWDEFEDVVYRDEQEVLRLLDGLTSVDNIMVIGMLNDIHELNERIYNRPSRFGLVAHIGMPTSEDRQNYINTKFPEIGTNDAKTIVEMTDGVSMDHLKETCLQFTVYETPLEEIAERFASVRELVSEAAD